MRRTAPAADDAPGQDSFLDVVANIVGILIILVMVVGVRAGQTRRAKMVHEAADRTRQIEEKRARAVSLQVNLQQLGRQACQVEQEIAAKRYERERWETLVLASEKELQRRRQALDDVAQADFDLKQEMASGQHELDRLTQEQISAEGETAESVTIENRPTPLSQTVLGEERHFQLRGGRIVLIPLEALLSKFTSTAQHKMWKLADRTELVDAVGPVGGFRLRYRLERCEIPHKVQLETGRTGSIVRLVRWELLPVANGLGEDVSEALAAGSQFRQALPAADRGKATVTIWTYPDSFGAIRVLKDELHRLGHAVAVRPLPDGMPIGGSPEGSRSAAQ